MNSMCKLKAGASKVLQHSWQFHTWQVAKSPKFCRGQSKRFYENSLSCHTITGYLPVNFLIDCNVVLYRHNRESGDICTVSINGNYFRHAISCQFFILIQVDLMSEILSEVRDWIEQSCGAHLSLAVVVTRNPLKRCCYTIYPNAYASRVT